MAFLLSPWKGSSVAIWIPERNCSPRSASQFSCTVPDLPGTRSAQVGRGVVLPSCQVYDAGEVTWASAASVLVVPYMLVNPQHPHACETGGVIRGGLQTRLDMGPHGIPRGSSLAGQPRDSGSLEAQLTNRPADRPGPQTRPGSTHPLVMFQECHRLAGVFAAHPASYCATGYAPGPRPKARRSPPPPHARDFERFSPQPGQAAQRSQDSMSSTRASGVRTTLIALQTDEQITPITTIKRHTAAGRVRHRPRSWKIAGIEVRSSPGTSTSTRNPQPTPGHPHSTRKNRFTGFKNAATEELPDATMVMDPFHVVHLAGDSLDECRRHIQKNFTIGAGVPRIPCTRLVGCYTSGNAFSRRVSNTASRPVRQRLQRRARGYLECLPEHHRRLPRSQQNPR